MFKVRITEVKEMPPPPQPVIHSPGETGTVGAAYRVEHTAPEPAFTERVLLEQTLERLNLRAVIDALNPPPRKHRAKP